MAARAAPQAGCPLPARWVWLAEAVSFAFGVEVLAVGALAGSLDVTIAGGMLLLAAAALAITGAGVTWAARR